LRRCPWLQVRETCDLSSTSHNDRYFRPSISSLTHGPPCACVLNLCVPCLKVLADRLIPTATPQPLSRAPPDHAFLLYSAKALKSQHLSRETAQAMDRLDWEEELKACQKRAGDVLWETAMEIELVKTTRDVMGMFERAYDEVIAMSQSVYYV
jgi:hypothetical protein